MGGWVVGCCAVDKPPGVLDDNVLRRAISTLLDLTSHVLAAATTLKALVSALVSFGTLRFSPLTGEFGNTRLVT